MIYCLDPDCSQPENPDERKSCQSCGRILKHYLRNRYKILGNLGKGGFGKTYLAKDRDRADRLCVVKQLFFYYQGTQNDRQVKDLFIQEAQQLQLLGAHPQIPSLQAYFEEDNYFYLVQELIKGKNLKQKLNREGIWNEIKLRQFLIELLPVLEFIHAKGIIHRNIKPSNIIYDPHLDRYVLIDFRLAKTINSSLIQTGKTLEFQGYTAPEQLLKGKTTTASDLYSLGVTCVELLSGIEPFELFIDRGYTWIDSWQELIKNTLSSEFVKVLDRLLKYDISERYQEAARAIEDLKSSHQISLARKIEPNFELTLDAAIVEELKQLLPILIASNHKNNPSSREEYYFTKKLERLLPILIASAQKDDSNSIADLSDGSLVSTREENLNWCAVKVKLSNDSSNKQFPREFLGYFLAGLILGTVTVVGLILSELRFNLKNTVENKKNTPETIATTNKQNNSDREKINFNQVKNVPAGLFNYGGSTTWASIRGTVDPYIQVVWPDFELRYTEAIDANPGSESGIEMLLSDQLSFAQSSRSLADKDYQTALVRGFTLEEIPVAIDAIAIAVHPSLEVSGLTVAQLQDIYTGKITNWQAVGGPNLPIVPYSRYPGEGGTVEFFRNNILRRENFGENVVLVPNTTTGLRRVASERGGIYYASAIQVIPQCSVQALPLARRGENFISPYQEPQIPPSQCSASRRNQINKAAFRSGEYPITRRLFVIVKKNGQKDERAGLAYAQLLLTAQGQKLIDRAGFVNIHPVED